MIIFSYADEMYSHHKIIIELSSQYCMRMALHDCAWHFDQTSLFPRIPDIFDCNIV